jgi:hypothetical protein
MLTPVERWILSSLGAVIGLSALAVVTFWLWKRPLGQWGVIGLAVWAAYNWGEAIGICCEQLLQAERDRRREVGFPDWRED